MERSKTAVILPCYNEGKAIADVVTSFKAALPGAEIFVFDNNSTDDTVAEAEGAGAIVRFVAAQGKGNVLRQAFALIDADIYVIADGDGTYEAAKAAELVERLAGDDLDMVIGLRRHEDPDAYRGGHVVGNVVFNHFVRYLFAAEIEDIFSGYRVLSRPFVKSFPALATGFETETELSLHAIQLKLPYAEVETRYGARAEGSDSKLNTFRDGFRILFYMLRLAKHFRPMLVFSAIAILFAGLSFALGLPVVAQYWESGLVPRIPTAVAAAALMVIAMVSFLTGVILESIAYAQREQKRLAYLSVKRLDMRNIDVIRR